MTTSRGKKNNTTSSLENKTEGKKLIVNTDTCLWVHTEMRKEALLCERSRGRLESGRYLTLRCEYTFKQQLKGQVDEDLSYTREVYYRGEEDR